MSEVYVNVYLVELVWGGPEEGGWWKTARDPVTSTRVRTSKAMHRELAKAQAEVDDANEGRPELSSVLSDGRLEARVERHAARPSVYPDHYE